MIPTPLDRYLEDVRRATALATSGQLVAGLDCLVASLHSTEAALALGEVWAPSLLRRYRQSLGEYIRDYGVALGDN